MRNEQSRYLFGVKEQTVFKEPTKHRVPHLVAVRLQGMLVGHPTVADSAVIASTDGPILPRILVEGEPALSGGVR